MNIDKISKIDIVKVEEINFNCEICGTDSFPKYEIKVNEEEDNSYPVCLICHNQIAKRVSDSIKKRRRNY
ncbi:MAG TPA: hypothetical protein QF753_02210 [Victivallales bacterium]|nr:hypothetical protein [Victivallales bacterium]